MDWLTVCRAVAAFGTKSQPSSCVAPCASPMLMAMTPQAFVASGKPAHAMIDHLRTAWMFSR
jgi:hypothetical protein